MSRVCGTGMTCGRRWGVGEHKQWRHSRKRESLTGTELVGKRELGCFRGLLGEHGMFTRREEKKLG